MPPTPSAGIPSGRGDSARAPRRSGARCAALRRRSSRPRPRLRCPGTAAARARSSPARRRHRPARAPSSSPGGPTGHAPSAPNRCSRSPSATDRWRSASRRHRAPLRAGTARFAATRLARRCSRRTNRRPPAGPSALRRSGDSAGTTSRCRYWRRANSSLLAGCCAPAERTRPAARHVRTTLALFRVRR